MGLKGVIFGGAIGAALGILYAPRAGKKTRAMLADKTEALWGEDAQANGTILGEVAKTTNTAINAGKDIFNEAAAGRVGDITKGINQKRQEFNKAAGIRIEEFSQANVRPVFSERNDELRMKIEEARRKIAKQVASNLQDHSKNEKIETSGYVKATSKPKTKTSASNDVKKKSTKKVTKKTTAKTTAKKPAAKKTTAKKTTKTTPKTKKTTKKSTSK